MDLQDALRVTEYFRARLAEEVRRSERYGRPFSVIFIASRQVDARDVFNNVRPFLRCTDIVEIIRLRSRVLNHMESALERRPGRGRAQADDDDSVHQRVAVILPETSREGAEVALARLTNQCRRLQDLSLGLAVYAEDGTNPQELLANAAASAGEDLRF